MKEQEEKIRRKSSEAIKKCKRCGNEFKHQFYQKLCPKCNMQERKNTLKEITTEKPNQRLKEQWEQRTGEIEIIKPILETEIEWDEDTFIPKTTEKCQLCQEHHWQDKKYRHRFYKTTTTIGITIKDMIELYNETKGMTTEELIKELTKRGLIIEDEKK